MKAKSSASHSIFQPFGKVAFIKGFSTSSITQISTALPDFSTAAFAFSKFALEANKKSVSLSDKMNAVSATGNVASTGTTVECFSHAPYRAHTHSGEFSA